MKQFTHDIFVARLEGGDCYIGLDYRDLKRALKANKAEDYVDTITEYKNCALVSLSDNDRGQMLTMTFKYGGK